jgi:hypothetical protein
MVAPLPLSKPAAPTTTPPPRAPTTLPKITGKLPQPIDPEPLPTRIASTATLLVLLTAFAIFTHQFHTPAHGGADQNAYLVAGKLLAQNVCPAFKPPDPYAFVGRMWIQTPDESLYPKYPLGLPLLVATVLKLGAPTWAYYISPVCMTFALLALFLLARQLAGSFAAILALSILAASPVTLALANNPNSHAPSLCFTLWGFYFLFQWWQRATFWRATLAGLLLGYAATIRYSEALLLLPLLLVIGFNLRWRRPRSWAQAITLLLAWAIPPALLLLANRLTLGQWTGYDATNESAAFSLEHFQRNWELMLRQFHTTGLFFTLPLGILGLFLLFARNWRLALVLWSWLLPGVLLYTAYYWAPENLSIGYARFFLTLFPPLAIGAAFCLTGAKAESRAARALAAFVIVGGAAAYNLYLATPILAADRHRAQTISQAADKLLHDTNAPLNSTVFAPRELCHHLQFVSDYRLYPSDQFTRRYIESLKDADPDQPAILQPQRATALYQLLNDKSDDDLIKLLRELTATALAENRRVFILSQLNSREGLPMRFTDSTFNPSDNHAFATQTLQTWTEPRPTGPAPKWRDAANPVQWQLIEIKNAQN